MGRDDNIFPDGPAAQLLHPTLQGQVDGRPAGHPPVHRLQVLATGEVGGPGPQPVLPQQEYHQTLLREGRLGVPGSVFQQTQPAQDRSGVDGLALRFVVKADVAADHRNPQRPAGPGYAPDAPFQLVIDLRPLRVAKIQAVGQGQRLGAGAGQVTANLGHRNLAAPVGVQIAVTAVAVNAQGDGLAGSLDAQHCGIAAWPDHRVGLDLMVIATIDAVLAGDVGRGQQGK